MHLYGVNSRKLSEFGFFLKREILKTHLLNFFHFWLLKLTQCKFYQAVQFYGNEVTISIEVWYTFIFSHFAVCFLLYRDFYYYKKSFRCLVLVTIEIRVVLYSMRHVTEIPIDQNVYYYIALVVN